MLDEYPVYFTKKFPVSSLVQPTYNIAALCQIVNDLIDQRGIMGVSPENLETQYSYYFQNLYKINAMIPTLKTAGIVKPLLLKHRDGTYMTETGDSRIMAMSLLVKNLECPALISGCAPVLAQPITRIRDVPDFYSCLEIDEKHSFTVIMTPGLIWFDLFSPYTQFMDEINANARHKLVHNYLVQNHHPGFRITPEWFLEPIDWSSYVIP